MSDFQFNLSIFPESFVSGAFWIHRPHIGDIVPVSDFLQLWTKTDFDWMAQSLSRSLEKTFRDLDFSGLTVVIESIMWIWFWNSNVTIMSLKFIIFYLFIIIGILVNIKWSEKFEKIFIFLFLVPKNQNFFKFSNGVFNIFIRWLFRKI